jgi:tetratricopeptide (TPR) repeat protein
MALRYDQLIPEVDYKLGTIFMELGKVARAIIHLERAVKIESKSGSKAYWLPDAYYQLGVACKKERRLKCAIKAFEEYLVIAPSDAFDRDSAKQYLKTLISNMSP